ncbi:hypothetical protein [Pontixanthobacter sp.]|uniref:hypothetical protein n=1 Tax=Pontixanthobacter sp. TaxID=2792078 RepID=UPI003C7BB49D
MIQLVEANWPVFVIALIIGFLVAWWVFVAMRRTSVTTDSSDILDEGKGAAPRNEALINAPPAAERAGPLKSEDLADTASVTPPKTVMDDLSRIKGVGPKLVALLHENGVTRFTQIAEWSDTDIDAIDAKMGRFQGRIRRDNWTEQARFLAADDTTGYEGKFGKL